MPADEVTRGTEVEESRVRTGPRHAAPKKPLFTRFHMPAGKAIASVAMPTAVLVGMGFTSTLALAAGNDSSSPPASKSLTADEYKDCVTALDGSKDASATPSPSASASADESADPTASPSASAGDTAEPGKGEPGKDSSSDSGSDDQAGPTPSASQSSAPSGDTGKPGTTAPDSTPSQTGGDLLGTIGDTITGILGGGSASKSTASPSPSATPSASASATPDASKDLVGGVTGTVEDTVGKAGKTVDDTVKDTTDTAAKTLKDTTKTVDDTTGAVQEAAGSAASALPTAGADADDCPVATDDTGGVDNKVPVSDDPWHLNASSLLLKGADYQGVVEVRTAGGTTKKVLKYVISDGTDIGDLHQTVDDSQSGKTYHVQAAQGSTSTIRDGDTVMYTQSISGNLFGLIPVTFSPDSPPPLNIPLIYFTNVKVTQAAQFGGTLHVPGMHVYTTG
ncbi:hypothetical protein AB0F77_32490 [Streptomyces sp. NPDC026672]|uniref:hypothetical protein n=1 Tax=unclassified Streptomyces TaxID=2593676 RepID=UPI0033D52403